jgi:hypothetical protein
MRYPSPARHSMTWFEFGLLLFAAALPIGLILLLVAPVSFFHVLGAVILGTGLIGVWVSALGLRLEHPDRWIALKGTLRRFASPPAPAGHVPER